MQIQNPFKRPSVAQMHSETLSQAEFELFQHKADAEYHLAMVRMYEGRIERLKSETMQ